MIIRFLLAEALLSAESAPKTLIAGMGHQSQWREQLTDASRLVTLMLDRMQSHDLEGLGVSSMHHQQGLMVCCVLGVRKLTSRR